MSIAVVVAVCANDSRIPCLTFPTVEEAEGFLTDIFGPVASPGWGSNKSEAEIRDLAGHFFTTYYDGCGGVYSFYVQEIQHGKPFVRFDLD